MATTYAPKIAFNADSYFEIAQVIIVTSNTALNLDCLEVLYSVLHIIWWGLKFAVLLLQILKDGFFVFKKFKVLRNFSDYSIG